MFIHSVPSRPWTALYTGDTSVKIGDISAIIELILQQVTWKINMETDKYINHLIER